MDYSKNPDLTVPPNNMRRYRVSGAKTRIQCPRCRGVVTQFEEDTVYRCICCEKIPVRLGGAYRTPK